MSKKTENSAFSCACCNKEVSPHTGGGYRNHCPHCLHSLHLDVLSGDRQSACKGLMRPVGITYSGKKGFLICHRCVKCGFERRNRLAEHTQTPDDLQAVLRIMKK